MSSSISAEACGNARLRDYLRHYFDEYQPLRDRFPLQHLQRDAAVEAQHVYLRAITSRNRKRVVAAADDHLAASRSCSWASGSSSPESTI